MSEQRVRELMEAVRTGQPVDESKFGAPVHLNEPVTIDDEVMVGKSVRLPMAVIKAIEAIASQRGSDLSKTIRRYIDEGVARDEAADVHDPKTIAALEAIDRVRGLVIEGGRERDQQAA